VTNTMTFFTIKIERDLSFSGIHLEMNLPLYILLMTVNFKAKLPGKTAKFGWRHSCRKTRPAWNQTLRKPPAAKN